MLFSYCSWFRDRTFASDCRAMNSVLSFGRESSCGKPVGQNGVRDRGVPAHVVSPGNASGRVIGHFGTEGDF
ncbi:hypothetical protein CDL15_Pgr008674 [Punica granatum]|uniref:Uncharacterized protein n=1 Tax=Punica granatum TaxID=22663 RepID=A0A218XCX4_PUNGR|nr:hypothetical protein CDL15_Pgr008674 [Punica granatum]